LIKVEHLIHSYDGKTNAVDGIDFAVERGEIFGFLGPNGAGKSTTQNILTGLLRLQKGHVTVGGIDLRKPTDRFYNLIGVCFEKPNLYKKLTGQENLNYHAGMYTVPTRDPKELLALAGLSHAGSKKVEAYSKGMTQRLMLARSMINSPQIWFLDEPLSGLDPKSSMDMKELIRHKRREGVTIFMTTHNMFVAEELCDRVGFINQGKIVALDTPRNLKLEYGQHLVRVEYRNADGLHTENLSLDQPGDKQKLQQIISTENVETIHSQEATLEQIFIRLTGRGLQ